jgi:hypothetical protein
MPHHEGSVIAAYDFSHHWSMARLFRGQELGGLELKESACLRRNFSPFSQFGIGLAVIPVLIMFE